MIAISWDFQGASLETVVEFLNKFKITVGDKLYYCDREYCEISTYLLDVHGFCCWGNRADYENFLIDFKSALPSDKQYIDDVIKMYNTDLFFWKNVIGEFVEKFGYIVLCRYYDEDMFMTNTDEHEISITLLNDSTLLGLSANAPLKISRKNEATMAKSTNFPEIQNKEFVINSIYLDCKNGKLDLYIDVIIENIKRKIAFSDARFISISISMFPAVIEGIEIIETAKSGYDGCQKYKVIDYERNKLNFFCQEITACQK